MPLSCLIGMGRQAFYANLPWFLWSQDVQVVAVCDADAWRADLARQTAEAREAQEALEARLQAVEAAGHESGGGQKIPSRNKTFFVGDADQAGDRSQKPALGNSLNEVDSASRQVE